VKVLEGKLDERRPIYLQQLPYRRLLAVLFLSGWFTVNSRADYSDRRQIIVFAIPASDTGEIIQRTVETLRCQLVNRDTDVRYVDITELPDAGTTSTDEKREKPRALEELALLRSEARPEFEMVLIGKDGGVKARTRDPAALENFLALIDTMPMRRAELQSRGSDDAACDVSTVD
jgi:hypothetical protein